MKRRKIFQLKCRTKIELTSIMKIYNGQFVRYKSFNKLIQRFRLPLSDYNLSVSVVIKKYESDDSFCELILKAKKQMRWWLTFSKTPSLISGARGSCICRAISDLDLTNQVTLMTRDWPIRTLYHVNIPEMFFSLSGSLKEVRDLFDHEWSGWTLRSRSPAIFWQ